MAAYLLNRTLLPTFILLVLSLGTAHAVVEERVPLKHSLSVSVDLENGTLNGVDNICCISHSNALLLFKIGENVDVEKVLGPAGPLAFAVIPAKDFKVLRVETPPASASIEVSFKGRFGDAQETGGKLTRGVSYTGEGFIGPRGAFLPASALWHPLDEEGAALYDAVITVPKGFAAVMEGQELPPPDDSGRDGAGVAYRWKTGAPIDGVNLVVGRYVVEKDHYKGVDIYTYFFSSDKELTRTYIDKTKYYIDLYEGLFPPYPFKKFAVVENLLPTGFGMPSYTLLGSKVIRLPFIPDVSLGHEFAHNWWGNSVYAVREGGNWPEALATYTADHLFQEMKGSGSEYRKRMLVNYLNYAEKEAFPLSGFKHQTTPSARAVGYSKGAMVFHMLRRHVGDEKFYEALRLFYEQNAFKGASPEDIRAAFEATAGEPLESFFTQWFARSGGPVISVEGLEYGRFGETGEYRVSFTLRQTAPYYELRIPVLFTMEEGGQGEGTVRREIRTNGEVERVEFVFPYPPILMEIDPDYDVFRILAPEEAPPSLASLLGDASAALVLPSDPVVSKRYEMIAEQLAGEYSIEVLTDKRISEEDLSKRPLLIFGGPEENLRFGLWAEAMNRREVKRVRIGDGGVFIDGRSFGFSSNMVVLCARDAGARDICLLAGSLPLAEAASVGRRLPHLTSKSYLVFSPGGGVTAGTFDGERPLRFLLSGWRALATLLRE